MFCCLRRRPNAKDMSTSPCLSTQEKLERLQNVKLFVLDNSVRETTVAQMRGHTVADKYQILDLVCEAGGIQHVLLGVFGTRPKVDDYFCQNLRDKRAAEYRHMNLYGFCELRDQVVDGIPDHGTPIGMERCEAYKIANMVVELDLLCPLTNWKVFTMDRYCALVQHRINYCRQHCHNPAAKNQRHHIFLNIRDFIPAWQREPERVRRLLTYLARMREPVMGVCFEDPTGAVPPCVMGDYCRITRNLMDEHGWSTGHLLAHVHQAYGLAEASVLEALMNGATGVWAGIPREGAACGHANSLTTIANLHRLGNPYVRRTYNLGRLRRAAIDMTKIITGEMPHPMTELYGARAFDICFDPSTGMGVGSDFHKTFDVHPKTRISTMCTAGMVERALHENFGDDFVVPPGLPEKMLETMEADLTASRKEEYNSVVGFASLYERAGGDMTVEAVKRAVRTDQEADAHPLIMQLHNYCNEWRSCRRANDRMITYIQFYDGFCAQVSALSCVSGRPERLCHSRLGRQGVH